MEILNSVTFQVFHDLWGINGMLLLLNEHGHTMGTPDFYLKNLSFYNANNQWTKFDKNLSAGSNSVE